MLRSLVPLLHAAWNEKKFPWNAKQRYAMGLEQKCVTSVI